MLTRNPITLLSSKPSTGAILRARRVNENLVKVHVGLVVPARATVALNRIAYLGGLP